MFYVEKNHFFKKNIERFLFPKSHPPEKSIFFCEKKMDSKPACKCMDLAKYDADVVEVKSMDVLCSNSLQHVHRISMRRKSDDKPSIVVVKYGRTGNEMILLEFLDRHIPNDKPHCRLLRSLSSDIMIMENGPLDLHDFFAFGRCVLKPQLSLAYRLQILKSIIEQVVKLHDVNVAHFDLSLENCLWSDTQQKIYIIDYEFATVLDPLRQYHFNTNRYDKCYCGKEGTMATEMRFRLPGNGFKCDVYALGIMALEILTCCLFSLRETDCDDIDNGKVDVVVARCLPDNVAHVFETTPHLKNFVTMCTQSQKTRPDHARFLLQHPLFDLTTTP